jgi:phospholipase/lecithinase/hemolysin
MNLSNLILSLSLLTFTLAASSANPIASRKTYTNVITFGDSFSDNGNLYALTGRLIPLSPPNFEGRL